MLFCLEHTENKVLMLRAPEHRTAFPILQYYPEVVVVILFCFCFALAFCLLVLPSSLVSGKKRKTCLILALSLIILQSQGVTGFENFTKPFLMPG